MIGTQHGLQSRFRVSSFGYKNRNCSIYFAAPYNQGHDVLMTFMFEDFSSALMVVDSLVTLNDAS